MMLNRSTVVSNGSADVQTEGSKVDKMDKEPLLGDGVTGISKVSALIGRLSCVPLLDV